MEIEIPFKGDIPLVNKEGLFRLFSNPLAHLDTQANFFQSHSLHFVPQMRKREKLSQLSIEKNGNCGLINIKFHRDFLLSCYLDETRD